MAEMTPNLKKLKVGFTDYEPNENAWEKFSQFPREEQYDRVISFPKSFAFPVNLKKLSLESSMLPWKDMTVVGSLPNLQVLNLRWISFMGEEWEPIQGEFPKLKFLLMDSLLNPKYWRAEKTHFPCLEHLEVVYCHELDEIPSEIGDIPTLQLIRVRYCNSRVKSSALKIQEEQSAEGNDGLQVRIH